MKRKMTIVGLFVLCFMLVTATALASPKSDLKKIWDEQTFGNARYHVTIDTQMALFGNVQNSSIIDVKRDPLFIRSEDSVTMFGKTQTATTYLVRDGNALHVYAEEPSRTEDGSKNQWVRYDEILPDFKEEDIDILLLPFDKIVRSVRPVMEKDDKQIYNVTLDGRTFYKSLKKVYEKEDTLLLEGQTEAELQKKEMMRGFTKELLETWKNTEAVTMMVMVKDHKIVGMQTELAPQMNAMIHIFGAALDTRQEEEQLKIGALAEAFLTTRSMKLTIVEVGGAECSAVPDEIVRTAVPQGSISQAAITTAEQGKNKTESSENKK